MPKREAQIEASLLTPGDVIKLQGHERRVVSVRSAFSSDGTDVYQIVRTESLGGSAQYEFVFHFTQPVTLVIGDE